MFSERTTGRREDPRRRAGDPDRGQSELVGVILVVGIVVLGVAVLLLTAGATLEDGQRTADAAQAEEGLSQLDSRASQVALGDSNSQRVDLGVAGGGGEVRTRPDDGWLRVVLVNGSTGRTDATVVNATLGAVVYEHDRTAVAYQGGGVWKVEDGHARMVSRPEFHLRNATLTLPVVTVGGQRAPGGLVRVVGAGPAERKFPNRSAGLTNKLRRGKVAVSVHSEYYRAWGRYFERHTRGYVWYDHDAETVHVVFLAVPRWATLKSGIIATSGAGELALLGTGAYVDSYDSSVGPYAESQSGNGTVEAVGDVVVAADATIAGDVRSGESVVVDNPDSLIDGDVEYTDDFTNDGTVTGNVSRIEGVAALEPIDGYVRESVEGLRARNDNDDTPYIRDRRLDIPDAETSAEIGPGRYYLRNLDLQGKRLVLNATGGDVTVGVRDWINLEREGGVGANLTVKGDGVVRVFVLAEDETEVKPTGLGNRLVNFHVGKESRVHVPGDRSPQFRLYSTRYFNGTVAGSNSAHATFVGVVYAPAGRTGPGYVYVKQADVFGAVMTGNLTLGQYGAVHYDYALREVPLPRSPSISRLEYMHVAVHRVNVSSAG